MKTKTADWGKIYKHKLKVAGAMDLYGLNRKIAETLSKDVEDLLSSQKAEILDEVIEKIEGLNNTIGNIDYGNGYEMGKFKARDIIEKMRANHG